MIADTASVVEGVPAWLQLLVGGGLFAFLGTIVTVYAMRRKDRAAAAQARFEGDIELNKYIRGEIDKALEDPLKEIAALKAQMESLTKRDAVVKGILQRLFQRQSFWDQTGRRGPMPMPTDEDQRILEITITPEDTLTPEQRAALGL